MSLDHLHSVRPERKIEYTVIAAIISRLSRLHQEVEAKSYSIDPNLNKKVGELYDDAEKAQSLIVGGTDLPENLMPNALSARLAGILSEYDKLAE